MRPIEIVSVGPGRDDLLTLAARHILDHADAVFCAPRHAVLCAGREVLPLMPFDAAFARMEELCRQGLSAAVMVSGDAGLYSLMPRLIEHFGRDNVHVTPGVSALQAFSAALGKPWQDAAVLSVHGRDMSAAALCHAAHTNRRVFLLMDAAHDGTWILRSLAAGGLTEVSVTLGDRLTYPDEYVGPAEGHTCSPLCMALLENPAPVCGLPPIGLPDEAFLRNKTPMTKREVRVQALAALQLPMDAVVWDVGAGTGSVSIECARQCPLGRVIAIEQHEEAAELIAQNAAHLHVPNVEVIHGHAPDALHDLPAPTHVFLGGTGRETEAVLALLRAQPHPVRVVATAVTLESVQALHAQLSGCADYTAIQLSAARLSPLGSYTALLAQNPVFLFAATIGGQA